VAAATEQHTSDGAIPSGFDTWLSAKRSRGQYLEYDADAMYKVLAERLARGDAIELRAE
jgi:hypothetical protein